MRLFVYGTLMQGGCREHTLDGARFEGLAQTRPEFFFVSCYDGDFPAMVPGGTQSVSGEVYDVDETHVARCDRIEGHPDFYRRRTIELGDGSQALTYVLPLRIARQADPAKIPSGDWRVR